MQTLAGVRSALDEQGKLIGGAMSPKRLPQASKLGGADHAYGERQRQPITGRNQGCGLVMPCLSVARLAPGCYLQELWRHQGD